MNKGKQLPGFNTRKDYETATNQGYWPETALISHC